METVWEITEADGEGMIPYYVGRQNVNYATQLAAELRKTNEFANVKLGNCINEGGETYCRVLVRRDTR